MTANTAQNVALIGAGPASLYAAEVLAKKGRNVVILNRDIKPGGLAEYGIYPNKYKMKTGLRRYFGRILERDNVHYRGHVTVGEEGDLSLDEVRELGFDAIVVAVGAQGTKWLGLPGEEADAVYHAKDLVYHYNCLPPYSEQDFAVGDHVCVVGLGNVCLDIVHWLVCERKVASVTAIARRGPAERAYTEKEMRIVSGALDVAQIRDEFDRIAPALEAVDQDPKALYEEITAHVEQELEVDSDTKFRIRFLRSPSAIEVDEQGQVTGLTCEITRLTPGEERTGCEGTGEHETIPCDTVVFAIGDSIEPSIGLPLDPSWRGSFATVSEPWEQEPERDRYMCYDPAADEPLWGTFVVGWARKASDGLVGKARADAVQGCDEILAYLDGKMARGPSAAHPPAEVVSALDAMLSERGVQPVTWEAVNRLNAYEARLAEEKGLPEFKHTHTEQMLELIDEESAS